MDSDEDDQEPQNEHGTPSTSQPGIPVLPLHQGPAASSQVLAASANSENEDSEYSDWTVTPETHQYSAAAGSFRFVITEKKRTAGCLQPDHYAVCAAVIVPRCGDQ